MLRRKNKAGKGGRESIGIVLGKVVIEGLFKSKRIRSVHFWSQSVSSRRVSAKVLRQQGLGRLEEEEEQRCQYDCSGVNGR